MKTSRGVIPLVAAILGVIALAWAFVTGISAALSGGGNGALPYEIVFIVAGVVVLAALIMAIVNLARGRSRVLAVVTIIVALVPIIAVVLLRVGALQ
ncbi:MAG: hypothetical protein ACKVOG_02465 [Rhodoglobus sp.]